jgi:hypothetical protein
MASIALFVAAGLWGALALRMRKRLVRVKGEVVSIRIPQHGGTASSWPVVRFLVAGEFHEVVIREGGDFRVGTDLEILYPEGEPGRATLRPRFFLGPLILLVLALFVAVAALSG